MGWFTVSIELKILVYFPDECGIPGPEMFITGGNEATPHEYPWMAALFFEMNGQRYFCGGTLVKN